MLLRQFLLQFAKFCLLQLGLPKKLRVTLNRKGMGMDTISTLIGNPYRQNETVEMSIDEPLAAALGDDFPYPLSAESDTTSPQWDFDYNVIDQFITSTPQISNDDDHNDNNNNNNNNHQSYDDTNNNAISCNNKTSRKSKSKEETKKQVASGGAKRKRQPSQVQDHIIAERKRRELLSQMFISLSAIVPGLKKTDKTSVLGETIKYMKQLQDKVKGLEEVAAKRTVKSVVVFNRSQLTIDDDGVDDNETSSSVDNSGSGGGGGGSPNGGRCDQTQNPIDLLPEIEVKISGQTLLLKIYCEEQRGVLAKLFAELDKHDMSVTNCSVIPFQSLALDITIAAQMERGFNNKNIKDFVRCVRSALRLLASSVDHRQSL